MGAFNAKNAAIFKVPENFCVVVMIPIDFPANEDRTPSKKELAKIVFKA